MQVLFINSRKDAQRNPGGDSVQMMKTGAALERLGVSVCVRNVDELDDLPACDVAHLFNIQEPAPCWQATKVLQAKGIPIVLSPIYWNMEAHWFEMAMTGTAKWRLLARAFGTQFARRLYLAWQVAKAPLKAAWRMQRALLTSARRVLPNSKTEAVMIQKAFALPTSFLHKIDVVPNGVDVILYEELPSPNQALAEKYRGQTIVMQVGTIYPAKNQLGLLEALYDLPVTVVFVGPILQPWAAYADACRVRAAERGNVDFVDSLPHGELPGVYALASVHALPSWRETPGLASLEAAAAGCRIVTTSIGSTRDYFGDLAWYCHPSEPSSIRKAVETALAAPATPVLRRRVLSEFTWRRAAEVTLAAYEVACR